MVSLTCLPDLANFAYRSFPFYASKALIELWWPFVRSDEVLFNVVLLLSGLDRSHLQGYNSVHTRQLMDQCLTLLNSRVQDPVAGINDPTLVSIATLASMEHDRGNMRALDVSLPCSAMIRTTLLIYVPPTRCILKA